MRYALALMLGMGLLSTVSAQTCTKESITGQYGLICTSTFPLPAAMIGNLTIGLNRGVPATVTGTGKANVAGGVSTATFTGTTTVNGDCSGAISLATGVAFPATLTLTYHVLDGGNEIRAISTDATSVIFTCNLRLITRI